MNHIVFRRSSDAEGREIDADLGCISGRIIQLQLPTHLEDISSTRIRENIDLGRDISTLIDPVVQDFIYRNSLYLREPQYKRILRAGDLEFSHISQPDRHLWEELTEVPLQGREQPPEIDPRDGLCILRDAGSRPPGAGFSDPADRELRAGCMRPWGTRSWRTMSASTRRGGFSCSPDFTPPAAPAAAMMWASC